VWEGKVESKVELYEKIRVAARDDGLSIRALAVRFKVHRRDVRAALVSPEPAAGAVGRWPSPVSGDWHGWIRGVLLGDASAPAKQRHTAKRIHDRLRDEKGVVISPSQCRAVVARIRVEIAVEVGGLTRVVFVPQTRGPGAEAEVDWGKFTAVIGGETMVLSLFSMWLAFSTKAFHYAYVNEAQESFTDAHVRAFEHFGGVPRRVRYDNLKTAAIKILRGRSRIENERFVLLRSHYGFESFFCEPGVRGAHEKGGVEGDIGRFRRNFLTPVPVFDTLADLNAHIALSDVVDARRFVPGERIGPGSTGENVHGLWMFEQGSMHLLPGERFNAATRITVRVDTKARVCVRNCYYSVPVRYAGATVTVNLGADKLIIVANTKPGNKTEVIAVHERAIRRCSETLLLDHYLEVLWNVPVQCPQRPRSRKPALRAVSVPNTNSIGTKQPGPVVIVTAPVCCAKYCSCIARSPSSKSFAGSPQHYRSVLSIRTLSQHKHADLSSTSRHHQSLNVHHHWLTTTVFSQTPPKGTHDQKTINHRNRNRHRTSSMSRSQPHRARRNNRRSMRTRNQTTINIPKLSR
jgi:transposase